MREDTRLHDLKAWVEKYGLEHIHARSGFTSSRTLKQYITQGRAPSWATYHKIRRALESGAK